MPAPILSFLGWPEKIEIAPKDALSKRRPNRKALVREDSVYNGVSGQTVNWKVGEVRELVTETRKEADGSVVLFDAEATAEKLLRDFGPDADAWAHFPANYRKLFGFRKASAKDLASWRKSR
tara:strand:- start:68 stop:433 length:366 start_codon:yes stop_codon:yes gene_type:complete